MFKLVVLFALVAVAVAKPGYLGGHLAYTSAVVAAPAVAVPSAVSHSYRTDVVSKPVIATYAAAPAVVAAPVLHNTVVAAAPVAYAAPIAYGAAGIHAW